MKVVRLFYSNDSLKISHISVTDYQINWQLSVWGEKRSFIILFTTIDWKTEKKQHTFLKTHKCCAMYITSVNI